jgi:lysozyme family protein
MEAVALRILADEGGVSDVGDGKGITRYGQTSDWLRQWSLPAPETPDDALRNYGRWMEQTGLALAVEKSVPLGYAVVTFAVHAGEKTAIKALQRSLGVAIDGAIGPITRAAILACDPNMVAHQVAAEYTRLIGRLLASQAPDRRRWAKGWNNRIAKVIEALT